MAKTKIFNIVDGRFHFKCPMCQAKRMISVPMRVRRRSFRCHKCREITRCIFNRRSTLREQQVGKAILVEADGNHLDINLTDISHYGVGFNVDYCDIRKISIGKIVNLRCSWNPRLFVSGNYRIKTISGQHVGAEIIRKILR